MAMGLVGSRIWVARNVGDSAGVVFGIGLYLSLDPPLGFSFDFPTHAIVCRRHDSFVALESAGQSSFLARESVGILGSVIHADCLDDLDAVVGR